MSGWVSKTTIRKRSQKNYRMGASKGASPVATFTMKTITVYSTDLKTGECIKTQVDRSPVARTTEGENYHQRIINTYHELECQGKLGDMSAREKTFARDVHTHAQNPAYWHSNAYGFQGQGE
jgi:hypothetical protein